MRRYFWVPILTACLIVFPLTLALAGDTTDYDHTFVTTHYSEPVVPLASPAADDVWPQVISPCNIPCQVGSNPHRGVDLGIARTDPVYSVFTGWAERFTSVDTDFEALTMRLDLDDDGSIDANENTFVTYMHIDISPRIEIGHRYVA